MNRSGKAVHRFVLEKLFYAAALAALVAAGSADPQGARFLVKGPFVPPADAPEYAADRVIVKFVNELPPQQIDALLNRFGARWLESGEDHAFDVLKVAPGSVGDWVDLFAQLPGVEYAEPDFVAWMTSTPNDSYFLPYQWNFYDYGTLSNGYASNFGVQGMSAWNTTSGAGVTVAIVDTGVAYENFGAYSQAPDLGGATFVSPKDFVNNDLHANDDNGHGTHVCGTICQTTNNAAGCAGLAFSCTVMPVKVLDASGSGQYSWIADGIRWAADNGASVINMSLGGSSGSSTLQSAVDYAWNKGVVICAAAGNSGRNGIAYPARYSNCIAVGATRFDGARCSYSQWGNGLDVMAPGGDANVDQNHDGYGDGILQQTFSGNPNTFSYYFFTGTSMATPHVSATAALVKANQSNYTNAQVRAAIENTCKDLGAAGYDTKTGWGLVNAAAAILY
jgi:serine protease